MSLPRVVLIRRDDVFRRALCRALSAAGFEVRAYPQGAAPEVILAEAPFATVVHVPFGLERGVLSAVRPLLERGALTSALLLHADDEETLGPIPGSVELLPAETTVSQVVRVITALRGEAAVEPLLAL
jgi:hypothetical protein